MIVCIWNRSLCICCSGYYRLQWCGFAFASASNAQKFNNAFNHACNVKRRQQALRGLEGVGVAAGGGGPGRWPGLGGARGGSKSTAVGWMRLDNAATLYMNIYEILHGSLHMLLTHSGI